MSTDCDSREKYSPASVKSVTAAASAPASVRAAKQIVPQMHVQQQRTRETAAFIHGTAVAEPKNTSLLNTHPTRTSTESHHAAAARTRN